MKNTNATQHQVRNEECIAGRWGKTVFTAFISVIVIKIFSEARFLILNFSPTAQRCILCLMG